MEQPSDVQLQRDSAPAEGASSALLPRWLTVTLYVLLVPLTVFCLTYIALSIRVQQKLTWAIAYLKGGLDHEPGDMSAGAGLEAGRWLLKYPVYAFQYLNQELLRDEVTDPRMARALALRKALDWGKTSARRDVIRTIVANMAADGSLSSAFSLDQQMRAVLEEMVAERRADPEMTYAEDRITDVLAWLAAGFPGRPKGPEKTRMQSLLSQYEKQAFIGQEAAALKQLAREWRFHAEPVARQCAERFEQMLQGLRTELSPDGAAFCRQQAEYWEARYRQGMIRVAEMARRALEEAQKRGHRIDHPYIYQYVSLLSHPFDEVRQSVAEGIWLYRHNQFTVRFLSFFAGMTAINPVMAVETARLTKEQHERLMRRANNRRLREAIPLLARIGVDYIRHPEQYAPLKVRQPDEFIRSHVIHALESVADEPLVQDLVQSALAELRRADLEAPGGPRFFPAEAASPGPGGQQ